MIEKSARENAKRIADKYIGSDGGAPKRYCDEALAAAGIMPEPEVALHDTVIATLAEMPPLAYHQQRRDAARMLGITVGVLDKLVRSAKGQAEEAESALPHWNVEPWTEEVSGATLLADIVKTFERYIVLPKGAADTIALWTLHAWTINAGDTSPFLVFVSPTKRCGKRVVSLRRGNPSDASHRRGRQLRQRQ
jgi:hypothetical protein